MNPIRFSDALYAIEEHYVMGAVRYFSNLEPNPWQMAHDRVEEYMKSKTSEELADPSIAYTQFRDDILSLLKQYDALSNQTQKIADIADAFHTSDLKRLQMHDSLVEKKCAECDERKNLIIERVKDTKTRLVCEDHRKEWLV